MTERLTPQQLDEILALQLSVAWAGESAGDPPRRGWWKTDLVDPEGGGDLFARLAPRTAAWASLHLVRAAARRADEIAREKVVGGDRVWTLFHLGFAIDEQIADRLAYHRTHQHAPRDVLGPRFLAGRPWSEDTFVAMLGALGKPKVTITPIGRQVEARGAPAAELVPLLAAALLPLAPAYPLPYVEAPA
jgi:hypothetical protein